MDDEIVKYCGIQQTGHVFMIVAEPIVEDDAAPTETPSTSASFQGRPIKYNLLFGTKTEKLARSFMEMGFERAQVERCLRESLFSPSLALEFLLNGIPEADQAPPGTFDWTVEHENDEGGDSIGAFDWTVAHEDDGDLF